MYFKGSISAVVADPPNKLSGDLAWVTAPYARRIRAIGLTGGSAINDTELIDLGDIFIARIY